MHQGNLDVMEIEKAYSAHSWAPLRSPGRGRRDDGSSFDDGRSLGGSTITSAFSKSASPTGRGAPPGGASTSRSLSTGSLPPAASPTRQARASPTKGPRPK